MFKSFKTLIGNRRSYAINSTSIPMNRFKMKIAQSCPTLCDLMDCRMPGFPVLHYLLEFAQAHVH